MRTPLALQRLHQLRDRLDLCRMPLVVVVVVQLGVGVGRVGELERLLDVVVADGRVPRLAALPGGPTGPLRSLPLSSIASLTTSQPLMRPLYRPTTVSMCSSIRASAVSRSSGLPSTPANAQSGVWLCHTSVWPTMNMPCFSPNSTYLSAGSKLYLSGSGCTSAHFSRFSGVIVLNCCGRRARAPAARRP